MQQSILGAVICNENLIFHLESIIFFFFENPLFSSVIKKKLYCLSHDLKPRLKIALKLGVTF